MPEDTILKVTRRRSICAFLAAFIFVRAFVPVGYMLQLGAADEVNDLALVFCPTQNSTLDLSLFQSDSGSAHYHHHGHAGPSSSDQDAPDDGVSVESSPDCSIWIGSTATATAAENSNLLPSVSISFNGPSGIAGFYPTQRAEPSPIRAPPSSV